MKDLLVKLYVMVVCACVLSFCNFAVAEQLTVNFANDYPYKNLIGRSSSVKIFFTNNDDGLICRVEVSSDNMKWASAEKKTSTAFFNADPLSNCLSRESAEQILFQSFLQFGRGL